MKPVFIDIHIHTSKNPNELNENYDVKTLVTKVKEIAKENPVLLSLSDHNTINKSAYLQLLKENVNVLIGVELHIRKYPDAPLYHCHILFNETVCEKTIDEINAILDKLYPNKEVKNTDENIPNIEDISNSFDNYDYMLLPHGGQSHSTFDKATSKGHRFDTSMEKSIYYNHFEGFTARSNNDLADTIEYFKRLGIDEFINLITCTDNYYPKKYPAPKADDASPFIPTWMLSEPTFDGLRIALSEKTRLFYNNEPPKEWNKSINHVELINEKCEIDVDLTPGLNVVIGGSSSGKTLFVDSLVKGIKKQFDDSNYKDFNIENILIDNPSGIVPHYINQNFIMQVLNSDDLDLGDIDIINEVFPQDDEERKTISDYLINVKGIIDDLVNTSKDFEHSIEQLSHIDNLSHLIVNQELQKNISSFLIPKKEELAKINYHESDYNKQIKYLNEIKERFENSILNLPYKSEIETLEKGLKSIFDISELSDKVKTKLNEVQKEEQEEISKLDNDNNKKVNDLNSVYEHVSNALKDLETFYKKRKELSDLKIQIETKEITVEEHKLTIENSFELTEDTIKEAINKYLKSDNRIESLLCLLPETLTKKHFSDRPKVNDYEDLSNKVYSEIQGKNKRKYKITSSQGTDFDLLSPGWKSAVILDLILGYDGDTAPIIIDQPEDNLATDYINHGLVSQIMKAKPKKQVILVSHNATIPMIGDAQNIVVCQNEAGKIIIKSGALESSLGDKRILDYIADITDGGKPSIRKRVKKYDLKNYREDK